MDPIKYPTTPADQQPIPNPDVAGTTKIFNTKTGYQAVRGTDDWNNTSSSIDTELKKEGWVNYDPSIHGNSSLPALNQNSIVVQPGAEHKNELDAAKKTAGDLGAILSGVTDSYGANVDEYLKRNAYGDTPEGQAAFKNLEDKNKNINTTTPEDEARINGAGAGVSAQYDPMIRKAEEQGRQGRASNLVAAAKNGGLDASGWVGIASLVGEDAGGPKGFEGVGGKLAQMGSEYDMVVSNIKSEQIRAVEQAKQAERQAVITGKAEDWKRVADLYTMAKQKYDDSTTMLLNKNQVLSSYQTYLKQGIQDATDRIKMVGSVGGVIKDEDKKTIDSFYGTGFADKYTAAAKAAQTATTQKEQLGAAKAMIDVLTELPPNEEFEFPPGSGTKYKGIGSDKDVQTWLETDSRTNKKMIVKYNKRTNELTTTPTGLYDKSSSSGNNSSSTKTYFTQPKADGSIGYYYGNKKDAGSAQELQKKAYLEGVSKSAGVLDPNEDVTDEEIIQDGKNTVEKLLDTGDDVSTVEQTFVNYYKEKLTPVEMRTILDHLHTKGQERDAGKWHFGDYEGKN